MKVKAKDLKVGDVYIDSVYGEDCSIIVSITQVDNGVKGEAYYRNDIEHGEAYPTNFWFRSDDELKILDNIIDKMTAIYEFGDILDNHIKPLVGAKQRITNGFVIC